ncbi:DNA/RNA non-specific endonuclease [Companilactobacillus sp.]|jgi:DNA-entry nuclease|uniref:DNA/RNA non-specific endonuclease n=1 Tax=Companilactobacillus sp. TaxID=2767905 RepID=UPI0025B9A683|nr:DNA/RNA non-specific endonuclease [Companilactobacillus sp.]MCH4009586.1 DNA/RNA non-specific endonuclease [Companilactobacillus sp.]MCH4052738.1 DNA/RNA non-specific endonuclease [Companilactobacillus sp.]MCH4077528.1 DNA/RNA non-specific endonuclease [Companilactobacillus sp.]MCH4126104.1 DNA/RNA non-specific endonuclease [Companilactobacillus sp.]MCI1311812.1 DNA/RNA non-specific endonuclease [Companilactobacillus sp.]
MKKRIQTIVILFLGLFVIAGVGVDNVATAGSSNAQSSFQQKASALLKSNKKLKKQIETKQKKIADNQDYISKHQTSQSAKSETTTDNSSDSKLADLNYEGKQEITVNNNNPQFDSNDLSTANGPWQKYGNLDNLNRVTAANALLNKSLMPTAKRERLFVNPTGWHNKKTSSGWLYNRSHLIGYQFTGQNNNIKNLMTGTASLNSPEMQAHEMDVAYYLKGNSNRYVRYRITPIFRGNELLARGVQMEAQSVGNDAIHFNVYIFNVEKGYNLNYNDGTSTVG